MTRYFFILLCVFTWNLPLNAQNTNISGVINNYIKVNQLGAGNCIDTLYVTSTANFSVDDTVLLIQMKGATIDVTNSNNFGTVLNHGNSGNYEFAFIKSVAPGYIILTSALTQTYNASGFLQLVRVPSYNNVTITGTLTSSAWNGQVGGVLVLFANGTLVLNADIDNSDKGFRGGTAPNGSFNCNATNYFYPTGSLNGGSKGEGIAEFVLGCELGRGAQANGGGGGNNNNAGGGGGGNFSSGGRGGNQVLYSPCTGMTIGGEGGKAQSVVASLNKIYMGGGGGSGHQNDNNNSGIHGKNGGGIIFISAQTLIGNNSTVKSNGTSNLQTPVTDGAGGGGASGTIIFDVANYSGNVNVELKGGNGGNINSSLYCLGTGGGGSGGVFIHSVATIPANVNIDLSGGLSGIQINSGSSCYQSAWGGANGQTGASFANFTFDFPSEINANAGIDNTICSGESIQLGSLPQPGLNYLWSNGAGTQSNPYVSPTTTTTYILTVAGAGVCPLTDTDTVMVTVQPLPQATFTYTFDCSGLAVTFTNTSTLITNSNWNFGDGTTSFALSPMHTFPDTGNYNVQLIVTNASGCIDTLIQNIHVDPPVYPLSSFNYSTVNCELDVVLTSTSLNDSTLIWDFGDGFSGNSPNVVHTYLQPGVYTISLIALNPCGSDTFEVVVTINPIILPVAAFSSDTTWCSDSVTFSNSSQNALSWFWNFGDGTTSTSQVPFHIYSDSGSYQVTLIATNLCGSDTLISQLNLKNFEKPIASFSFVEELCTPSVSFVNTSQYASSTIWYLGDGSTALTDTFIHLYQDTGAYNVLLIAENECGIDSFSTVIEIEVIEPPEANFAFNIEVCSNQVNFFDSSFNESTWSWYFGDGDFSFEKDPIHEYEDPGFYEVALIVNEGTACADTALMTVIIDDNSIEGLFIPNAFTPNNDGRNDYFEIKSEAFCEMMNIKIFNRWGQQVFESDNKYFKWDGKQNGTEIPEGVYYYVFTGKINIMTGSVSVFR